MPYDETDNVWLVCLNCEAEFSLEEVFFGEEDTAVSVECPICDGHEFRRCDSYGIDFQEDYDTYEGW